MPDPIALPDAEKFSQTPHVSSGIDASRAPPRAAFGYACGLVMAFGASISFAAARAGVLAGLAPDDMIFGRFVVAGIAMLPLLIY